MNEPLLRQPDDLDVLLRRLAAGDDDLLRRLAAGELPDQPPITLTVVTPRPRLALTPTEAAEALGVSPDYFAEHIDRDLRWVRRGRKRLVPMREVEAWLDRSAVLDLGETPR